jgi:hypothetical protein
MDFLTSNFVPNDLGQGAKLRYSLIKYTGRSNFIIFVTGSDRIKLWFNICLAGLIRISNKLII